MGVRRHKPKGLKPPHVYDKAKYHYEAVSELRLSPEEAENHTAFFLRWLIERFLVSAFFERQGAALLRSFRAGEISIHRVYARWDRCLIDSMLSEEGNVFAQSYFDFCRGDYMRDYAQVLQRDLPSTYHVQFTEENYQAKGRSVALEPGEA